MLRETGRNYDWEFSTGEKMNGNIFMTILMILGIVVIIGLLASLLMQKVKISSYQIDMSYIGVGLSLGAGIGISLGLIVGAIIGNTNAGVKLGMIIGSVSGVLGGVLINRSANS